MSERLTVSLEDGIPEKLRTLAGGERKVGAYLSDVVAWLWANREKLDAYSPSSINVEKGEEIKKQLDSLSRDYNELKRDMKGIESLLQAALEASATLNEDDKAAVRQSLIQRGILVPIEKDSSQNDA